MIVPIAMTSTYGGHHFEANALLKLLFFLSVPLFEGVWAGERGEKYSAKHVHWPRRRPAGATTCVQLWFNRVSADCAHTRICAGLAQAMRLHAVEVSGCL